MIQTYISLTPGETVQIDPIHVGNNGDGWQNYRLGGTMITVMGPFDQLRPKFLALRSPLTLEALEASFEYGQPVAPDETL